MIFNQTALKDAWIIDLNKLSDERGFFARTYGLKEFKKQGIQFSIAQSNVSYNRSKQTLRGMHYQEAPHGEAKLVRCIKGGIYDVIIDLRAKSPTSGNWTGVELTEQNYRMLYVPEGFAHGFMTLEDNTEVTYQMSAFYTPGAQQGIPWNDPFFDIEWPMEPKVISKKDRNWAPYKKES